MRAYHNSQAKVAHRTIGGLSVRALSLLALSSSILLLILIKGAGSG